MKNQKITVEAEAKKIMRSLNEVKLIEAGKKKAKSFDRFLKQL